MEYERAFPPVQPVAEPAPQKRERSPWGYADMAKAIAVVVGALIVVSIPVIAVLSAVGGEMDDDDEAVVTAGIGLTFVLEGFLLLAAALFSVRKYDLSWSSLGLRPPRRGGYWFPLPLFFAALAILLSYGAIISALGFEADTPDQPDSIIAIVLLGILALALAPFMEEVFFRGFLFGGLRGRWGVVGAASATGLLFALVHFQGVSSLAVLPLIGIIGALFAWGYYYTGSLFASIVAHFFWNLMVFIFGVLEVGT
jgi:membrane protease YdiL (CAAX protease family)